LVISLTDNALLTLSASDEHPLLPKVERLSALLTKRLFDLYSRQQLRRLNSALPTADYTDDDDERQCCVVRESTNRAQTSQQSREEDDECDEESGGGGGRENNGRDEEPTEPPSEVLCDIGMIHSPVSWSDVTKGTVFVVGHRPRKHWLPLLDHTVGLAGLVIDTDARTQDVLLRILEPRTGVCEEWWYHYTDLRKDCDSCAVLTFRDLSLSTKTKESREFSKDAKELSGILRFFNCPHHLCVVLYHINTSAIPSVSLANRCTRMAHRRSFSIYLIGWLL